MAGSHPKANGSDLGVMEPTWRGLAPTTFVDGSRDIGKTFSFEGETGESRFQPWGMITGWHDVPCVAGFHGHFVSWH